MRGDVMEKTRQNNLRQQGQRDENYTLTRLNNVKNASC